MPDFSDYEISDQCRVRNAKGKILRPVYDPTCRYVRYCFRQNGKQLTKNAHRVMWRAFRGEIPPGMQLNHIDGNRLNNLISNLELVTPSRNTKHAYELGFLKAGDAHPARQRVMRGEPPKPRLTEDVARSIVTQLRAGNASASEIARTHGVSRRTVQQIQTGVSWKKLTGLTRPPR